MKTPLHIAATALLFSLTGVYAIQIPVYQFSGSDTQITFETGSTGLPSVSGAHLSGGDATFKFNNIKCFGNQYFGNFNGSSYLDITFDQPQQAVGAYIVDVSSFDSVVGVIEVVYDKSNNIIETQSSLYPPSSSPQPAFIGIGEPTAQIYRVEWQYIGSGYFGVDNVAFGDATGLSQMPNIPIGLTASPQGIQIRLNWFSSDRATGYNVKRSTTSNGSYTIIGSSVTGTNYTDTTVTNGGTYYYAVTAVNAYGESSVSHQATAFVVDHFSFSPVASPQTSSVPFSVTIFACDSNGVVLTNFTGAAMLSAAGDQNNSSLTPGSTTSFANGQWTGMVTIAPSLPDTGMRLFANSNSVTGMSGYFDVLPPLIQLFNLTAADLVYDRFAQRIYASVPASAPVFSNSLVVIDPILGRVETTFYLGDDPSKMALSSDGHYLYIGFNGTNVFRRFNLTSHLVDVEGYLGFDSYYTWLAYNVVHLTTIPGKPNSVAVVKLAYGYDTQLQIFDDAVPRTNLLAGVLWDHQGTATAASSAHLYSGAPFTRLNLDSSGVVSYDNPSAPLGGNEDMKYQNGLIFTASGKIFNPETLTVQGSLTNCSVVEPDVVAGSIFAMGSHPVFAQPDAWTLYAWNCTNLQMVASLPVPNVLGSPLNLLRWGKNGLAFCTSQNQVYLLRTPLVPYVSPVFNIGKWQSSGSFQLNFVGDPYCSYSVWASTNLVNWTLLGTANPVTNGTFQFVDPAQMDLPHRFYRAGSAH